jgi:hypothetical protein
MATERIGQSNAISTGYDFEPGAPPPAMRAGERDEVETVRAEPAATSPTATRLMVLGRVMGRMEDVADGQVPYEGLPHSTALFVAERNLEVAKAVEEIAHAPGRGTLFALPLDAFLMAAEIGQANLDAKRVNAQRDVVEHYADGVAAALDPAFSQTAPADLAERHAWLAGKKLVEKMSPQEKKELRNVLADARDRETGFRNDAAGRTYREGLLGLWEGTVKGRIY